MKTDGHDPIGEIKRFLHSITMMNIDVDIQHARVILQELQDAYHNVIYVAKSWRLKFLRMMKSTTPVYTNITLIVIKLLSSF